VEDSTSLMETSRGEIMLQGLYMTAPILLSFLVLLMLFYYIRHKK
jgi:hypothetical protein